MSTLIRRLLILTVAASLLGGLVVPLAVADGPSAVTAKKGKCKKKGAKKAKGKAKKCVRSTPAAHPGLPGKPLSPDTPVSPPPSTVTDLTVTSNPVLGGNSNSGQVTISEPAPSGGRAVTLESGDPGRASVPASVHVAAGQTSAGFSITTTAGPTVFVPIEASIGPSSQQVQLEVVEAPSVESVALDYKCFPGLQTNFGANLVTTDVPVPADTTVTLGSDNASLVTPPSVTVLESNSSAGFGVATLLATPLAKVTATLGTSSAFDTASVRSASTPSALVDLALNPSSVLAGGTSTGTVTLDCEALATTPVIALSSDNPDVTVPATVTVPEGQLSATFQVTTSPSATRQAVITATLGGDTEEATLLIDQLGT